MDSIRLRVRNTINGLVCALALMTQVAVAQELEPRRWSHLPVGATSPARAMLYRIGYLLQSDVTTRGCDGEVHTRFAYLRVLDVFGKSGRIDVRLPYSWGDGRAAQGQPASTRRSGFGDPRIPFRRQRAGSPAHAERSSARRRRTYLSAFALKSCSARRIYRRPADQPGQKPVGLWPQVGVVHSWNKWAAEITGSAWLYTDNDDFDVDKTRDQDPLFSVQGHLIYTVRPRSVGLDQRSVRRRRQVDDRWRRLSRPNRKFLWAATAWFAKINRRQGVKTAYVLGVTTKDTGSAIGLVIVAYSVLWGGQ